MSDGNHNNDGSQHLVNARRLEYPSGTILIVDDDPLNLTALGALLEPHYRVRAANSGERALQAVASNPPPDLILLDILMPGMDGFDVLRHLRENPDTRDIPVIIITALHDEDKEQQGLELGAADYVHKPIKSVIVLSRIRAQLDAKAARDMLRSTNQRLTHQVEEGAHALEQAQTQLLQVEKMAAMGQLAAGIAHEINNPVGFVGSNLVTLESYLQDMFALVAAYEQVDAESGSNPAFVPVHSLRKALNYDYLKRDIGDLLAESRDGIARVRQIVRDLKDFSHVSETEWQWADLHQGLDSTLNIVWNELKYHCTVTKHYGELPLVQCLPSQLNQVFMNLLVNAAHAIDGQGDITISTERVDEKSVRIIFADTGRGIAKEDLPRVFEVFYTTKPVGQGTGLGLSLARGIMLRHGGTIEVTSVVGQGTRFTLTLPIEQSSDPV
jgi:signal transduction histidine kinase